MNKTESSIRAYLESLSKESLEKTLADIIFSNSQLTKFFKLEALLAEGDFQPKVLKKLITQALPKKTGLFEWGKVREYFEAAEPIFVLFFEHASHLEPEQYLALIMAVYERLNVVLLHIDDSGGFRLELCAALEAELVECFHQLPWNNQKKIQWLLDENAKGHMVFPYVPQDFSLDDVQMALYRRMSKKN